MWYWYFKIHVFNILGANIASLRLKLSRFGCFIYFWIKFGGMNSNKQIHIRRRNNIILFMLSIIYIFLLGLFDGWDRMHFVYFTFISAIYMISIYTVKDTRTKFFYAPAFLIVLTWISELLKLSILSQISGILSTVYFLYVIVYIIKKVARSRTVGFLEFLESINVYLLLGIAGAILFKAVDLYDPNAFNHTGDALKHQSDYIYFSFVTLTTLGYGDITPISPIARSLSIFFSVSGQLYLTMIIAMLVGKYICQETTKIIED